MTPKTVLAGLMILTQPWQKCELGAGLNAEKICLRNPQKAILNGPHHLDLTLRACLCLASLIRRSSRPVEWAIARVCRLANALEPPRWIWWLVIPAKVMPHSGLCGGTETPKVRDAEPETSGERQELTPEQFWKCALSMMGQTEQGIDAEIVEGSRQATGISSRKDA